METIQAALRSLHTTLRDYIEATYHIRAPSLVARRKALLDEPGVIYQNPYVESTPRYRTGKPFASMPGLPAAALAAYEVLAREQDGAPRLVFDPPYQHQFEAVEKSLVSGRNLVIMTGTGSGKTEAFLLPILGGLARQAHADPESFDQQAMRALVLYPMNALVNDQLGRLRRLFGDRRIVDLFRAWGTRPPRFARYTSRTPYPGLRTPNKDSTKLSAFRAFFVALEERAHDDGSPGQEEARRLIGDLQSRGKWPAKPSLRAWFGEKGGRWQDASGTFVRAVAQPDDSELLTRHEVQVAPPDLLVTNYSMLEYMLLRPIERTIFDQTREWLERRPEEKFLVVLDEAHLYRGTAGAEVGLLMRRLRDRLGIPAERLQVICSTASFHNHNYAPDFGAQLTGSEAESFSAITALLALRPDAGVGSAADAQVLASLDLDRYYAAATDSEKRVAVRAFLAHRGISSEPPADIALHRALSDFPPMSQLVNATMQKALRIRELAPCLFPEANEDIGERAVTALMALGAGAREAEDGLGLLACRAHAFFRGLPGLWACLNPACADIPEDHRDGICGRLYSQPRERCTCGALVFEFFTCRNCGSAYSRAYTANVEAPDVLWRDAGEGFRAAGEETAPLCPIDILLEVQHDHGQAEPADLDLDAGIINPEVLGNRSRRIHLRGDRATPVDESTQDDARGQHERGLFIPCAICGTRAAFGRSSVQDHQTTGDQPFQALVTRQIQLQPPNARASRFAPLQGRKVLTFSDSRQVAARLAPNLQMYSTRDSLRSLITWGFRRLQEVRAIESQLCLEDLHLAVLIASRELNVRVRPELKSGESLVAEDVVNQAAVNGYLSDDDLADVRLELRSMRPPEALLESIVGTLTDSFLGLEPLALASIRERDRLMSSVLALPDLPGIAETNESKLRLVRAWLRCWRKQGFWLNAMPPAWWLRPRKEGMAIRGHTTGKFAAMRRILPNPAAQRLFERTWLRDLLHSFAARMENTWRLRGDQLTLELAGSWMLCETCRSVHRPVLTEPRCIDCGSLSVRTLNPDADSVFQARKGFYRNPVSQVLADRRRTPMAIIAAEHTAQLNAPQHEDVFSQAERHELLFQDVAVDDEDKTATAIDVLSSTTTMEVGIDIGSLSGVALRNMPPSRANYQQRSGRAGRRGRTAATVIAFGSADSHDEHYFVEPDGMIRGKVVDPKLTLDNPDIVRRHIRAFLLQAYHEVRLPANAQAASGNLFSVLGTVSQFRDDGSPLNRNDFEAWLQENENTLQDRIRGWIPFELSNLDSNRLCREMRGDCLEAIDGAIAADLGEEPRSQSDNGNSEDALGRGASAFNRTPVHTNLLDRLLHHGVLPRYAFPTDVVSFHVFDRERSSPFRAIYRFAPQQGLPVALTQYAPSKLVWISGKCYTSQALYSAYRDQRTDAWRHREIYMECSQCGFARKYPVGQASQGEKRPCEACGGESTYGPGRSWLRPPGFAHPIDKDAETSPDAIPQTSYATRAKLTIGTPGEGEPWIQLNPQIRLHRDRQHLLVSNSGPRRDGYTYCVRCGRIESEANPARELMEQHRVPYPARDADVRCPGAITRHLVLGAEFITDIVLMSLKIAPPLVLRPGDSSTVTALRSVSEALAAAACRTLEIEANELMAEFRPALSADGMNGREAEIFIYDTLPGGAGFARLIGDRGLDLFLKALDLMERCPEDCDASCYRCLRSFKNKFEHALLDRHIGIALLRYLIDGGPPCFSEARTQSSTELLYRDLQRQAGDAFSFSLGGDLRTRANSLPGTILGTNAQGHEFLIALSHPLTDLHPAHPAAADSITHERDLTVLLENELRVRRNIGEASRRVLQGMTSG